MGAYLAVSRLVEDTAWEALVIAFYVLLLLGLAGWQARAARTWPRRTRRTSWVGLGATVVLFLGAVIAFNVADAQQEAGSTVPSDNAALLVLAGLVVAAPMLAAAVLIDRREPR
jgi:hypothetical protein